MARTRKRKPLESGETVARKIWLAGLGAYGKSVEDAHGQIDKASQEASKFFHDLVNKGQSIEDHSREALKERISEAKGRISEARERISEAAGSNTRSVEEMIGRVRERMGVDDSVHTRLDALARHTLAHGVRLAYHHHMGAYVETPADVDALMAHTGPEVGLLFDTGHMTFAGGDAAAMLAKHVDRVCHVHCKDVRKDVLAATPDARVQLAVISYDD